MPKNEYMMATGVHRAQPIHKTCKRRLMYINSIGQKSKYTHPSLVDTAIYKVTWSKVKRCYFLVLCERDLLSSTKLLSIFEKSSEVYHRAVYSTPMDTHIVH